MILHFVVLFLFVISFFEGCFCTWMLYEYGMGYFIVFCSICVLSACFFLSIFAGDTYPYWMKLRNAAIPAIGGGFTLFIPIYLISRIKRGKVVIKGIVSALMGASLSTFTVCFLGFITLFRGV